MRLLLERQVDGLIVGFHPETPQIRFLESTGTPFVLLNRGHGDFDADMVCAADAQASRVMVDHLVELGHRRIAYIGGHPRSENAHVRHDGFIAAMARARPGGGPGARGRRCLRLSVRGRGGGPAARSSRTSDGDLCGQRPEWAMGATKALFSKGFRVPEDTSVAGIDDILIASMPGVGLTTVRIPKWDIGAAAVRLLLRRILGERDDFPATVTFPVELITRNDHGAAARLTERLRRSALCLYSVGWRQRKTMPQANRSRACSAHSSPFLSMRAPIKTSLSTAGPCCTAATERSRRSANRSTPWWRAAKRMSSRP